MSLKIVTKAEYRRRVDSYWKKDLKEDPDMLGIAFNTGKAYVLIDNIARTSETVQEIIDTISYTCVHELIHLSRIKLKEKKVLLLERLLCMRDEVYLYGDNIINID